MQLMYLSSQDDLGPFASYTFRRSAPQYWRDHLRVLLLGSISPVLSAVLLWFIVPPLHAVLLGGLFVIGWPFFYWWRSERQYRQVIVDHYRDAYVGSHTLMLDDEGLTEQTQIREGRCTWEQIRQIVHHPPYTYVYMADSNLLIIPHHRVCLGDAATFIQELERRSRSH